MILLARSFSAKFRSFLPSIVSISAAWTQIPLHAAVDFNHQIVPLLRKHCGECHTGDKLKGGFSMNDRKALLHGSENGPVIDLEKPEKSLLLELVTTDDKDKRMPPKGSGLSAAEAALLRQWVAEKLPWEPGFAFKAPAYEPPLKPRKVELPAATAGRSHPVDRILDAYYVKNKLAPLPPISDAAFMRRVSLDLVGLLPEPEALANFTASTLPNKRSRLISFLLDNDIGYADHWLTFWNDLLRNDYTGTGFITGGRKQITKWLYQSLKENKSYDKFAQELIAPKPDSAGFSEGIKWRGTVSAGQTVPIQFAQSVSQTFLGINMKCASCHDSFIDRWKLDEAYGLAAVVSDAPLEVFRCDKSQGRTQKAAWLFPELGQIDAEKKQPERQKQLAMLMTHPENGRFTRTLVNRFWHRLMGHGIVHPVDSMQTEPWSSDLLDFLAVDFAEGGYDMKKTLALICNSHAYQSAAQIVGKETDAHGFVFHGPRTRRFTAEQFVDAVWQLTGAAPSKFDAEVVRTKLNTVAAATKKLEAQWIWGAPAMIGKAPAAGETIAMRRSFKVQGKIKRAGAVITCDNEYKLFINGAETSKGTSWEQMNAVPLELKLKSSADNDLLVVANNTGDGPNDAGLFAELRIVTEDGKEQRISSNSDWEWTAHLPDAKGKFKKPPTDWKPCVAVKPLPAWSEKHNGETATLLAQLTTGDLPMVRAGLVKSNFLMRALGRPNRDQIVSMRPGDLGTLEAITLANGPILADTLETGASNLMARKWAGTGACVQFLYRFALSRDPSADELAAATGALGSSMTSQGMQDMLWALIMLPEFQINH